MITNRSHLEMAENLMRGFVSPVFSKRLVTMNKEKLEGLEVAKVRTYGLLVGASNVIGGMMHKFSIPLSNFEIVHVERSSILKTANVSEFCFLLEANLYYLDALHNLNKDFPLAPTKEKKIAICCSSIRWVY